jgi:hypothetical protein
MGEKIKIRDIEGDSEEVIRLFNSADCSLSEYLSAHKPTKIPFKAICGVVFVFFLLNCALWILSNDYPSVRKVLILASFILGGGGTIMSHMNWKNPVVTTITAITALLVICVSMDVYTPEQAVKKVEQGVQTIKFQSE